MFRLAQAQIIRKADFEVFKMNIYLQLCNDVQIA